MMPLKMVMMANLITTTSKETQNDSVAQQLHSEGGANSIDRYCDV